ncbi:MAG TPA: pyridoxamine 5'-phosphate oxidase family protein [Candidatus Sulfotelmatobacter sp.]|nr:pyridoxamine 5'-phosphate oxidase family protein [Candidatus Sulfotelmatobacter sp.]
MPDKQIAKIHEMLENFKTAMLVTQAQDHTPHARPMAIARVDDDCGLWFFTGHGSGKVQEIEEDQHVLIVCQDERSRYISLSGNAELVLDSAQARELWKESYKTWFPKGIEDPDLLLIHVRPNAAEYWDNQGVNSIRYVFEAIKGYASGKRPHIKEGEQHGKIALR